MNCPVCKKVTLVMADRQGIEVDCCPQCCGIWLDRGELDKIIERSAQASAAIGRRVSKQRDRGSRGRRDYHDYDDDEYHGYPRKKKKRGFLN
ncbi:MAG: hypothetical protein E3K32_10710 [wastewater metagenome]|nr:hypothetical protein [Candidatus Loosdrechtia aerotolerans]